LPIINKLPESLTRFGLLNAVPPPLPVATVKLNVVASPFVKVKTLPLTLPVLIKLPVSILVPNELVATNLVLLLLSPT